MADAALTFLLQNLKQLMVHQAKLISDAKDELLQLQKDLEILKGLLVDMESSGQTGEMFKAWESQVRDMVYEVEDTIDTCVTEAALRKGSILGNVSGKRISLAEKVKSLRQKQLNQLFTSARVEILRLQIPDKPADTNARKAIENIRKPRKPENIVGLEDVTETLIQYLTQESEELEAISIIGMPGLGKTTAAWKIFHHKTIQYEFPKRVWVTVSNEFDKKDVLLTILKAFTNHDLSRKSEEELVKMVRQKLERTKFLIVLDDVWTTDVWEELEDSIFPKSNGTSKIMVTSREERVARRANRRRQPHLLRFLTQEESWKLLQLEVGLHEYPPDLEHVGRRIAEQCDGLPLSIVVIGGILYDISLVKRMVGLLSEWEKISDGVKAYVIHEDKHKRMESVILMSYNKLPYETRDCFLYLGMFPEDYEIPTWKLIQLWIGEGFIRQGEQKSLEEIAEDNLMDFINRNLVMIGKAKPDGTAKTIRVHDAIGGFCKQQVANDKSNLFQEIKMSREGVFRPSVTDIEKHRRFCIHSHVHDFLQKKPKAPKARTFLCFSKSAINLKKTDVQSFTDIFKLLRVFDANTIRFPIFPPKIIQLIHLRCITLSGDELKLLPERMSNLWNLQTLIVDTVQPVLEVSLDIWKMLQLRHFKTKASIILKKLEGKGEGGENLQTLTRLSPTSCNEDVFRKAKNLTTLGVRGQLDTLPKSNCFENLLLLKNLKLVNDVYPKAAIENPLQRLPEPDKFPPNLKILTLSGTFLEWPHMSTLGQLSYLEVLKLKENAFMGATWNAIGGGFLKLEYLHIERTDLVFWKASGDPFPRLRVIVLNNCEELQEIPNSFGDSRSLQMLSMERVKKAVKSARKIEEAIIIKRMQEQHRPESSGFKLLIAPGDE